MSFEDTVQRILSVCPSLTREEVLKKIAEKERDAKGFLTAESAARVLATELGVQNSEDSWKHGISFADLIPGLNNVTVTGRVILVHPVRSFVRADGSEGVMRRLVVADGTGKLKVVLWGEPADLPCIEGALGRIARFSHARVRRGLDGKPEISIDSAGDLEFSPSGVPEGAFPSLASFFRGVGEVTGSERSVDVVGAVARVFPLTTFKRSDGSEGKVRRVELEGRGRRVMVVLWDRKAEEVAEAHAGGFLAVQRAKVRKSANGGFELHVNSYSGVSVLSEA